MRQYHKLNIRLKSQIIKVQNVMIEFLKAVKFPNYTYLGFLNKTFAIILYVGDKGLQYELSTGHRDML